MTPEDYQRVSRELARETMMPAGVADHLEQQLERAFEENTAGERVPTAAPRQRAFFWWAAAASLVLVIGATAWILRGSVSSNIATRQQTDSRAGTTEHAGIAVSDGPRARGQTTSAAPHAGSKVSASPRGRPLPPIVQPAGFIPLPAARELPQFESGVIVRVSLPVAALPSYGVDISPASSVEAVEADVLVAQDGVARAIRLVNASRSQQ